MTSTPVRDSKRDLTQVWRNGKIIFNISIRLKPAGSGLSRQDLLALKTGAVRFHETVSPFWVSILQCDEKLARDCPWLLQSFCSVFNESLHFWRVSF